MADLQQIERVAGELNAAGHSLERALEGARKVSAADGHAVAQLHCAVTTMAEGWFKRAGRTVQTPGHATTEETPQRGVPTRDPTEAETLERLRKL